MHTVSLQYLPPHTATVSPCATGITISNHNNAALIPALVSGHMHIAHAVHLKKANRKRCRQQQAVILHGVQHLSTKHHLQTAYETVAASRYLGALLHVVYVVGCITCSNEHAMSNTAPACMQQNRALWHFTTAATTQNNRPQRQRPHLVGCRVHCVHLHNACFHDHATSRHTELAYQWQCCQQPSLPDVYIYG